VRVWIDITEPSHVLFLAPVVRRLEAQDHVVTVTARRFASADTLLRRYGLTAVIAGSHRGGGVATRVLGLANRTAQLLAALGTAHFDVAAGSHASDMAMTAWTLGVPQLTFVDDDRLQRLNAVNARLVNEIAVPDVTPLTELARRGAPPEKLMRYPGFREEYYLCDVRLDPDVLRAMGVEGRGVIGVVRPPVAAGGARAPPALPAAGDTGRRDGPSSASSSAAPTRDDLAGFVTGLATHRDVTLIVLPRSQEQQSRIVDLGLRNVVMPQEPVDGASLLAAADFVVGGGTMMREAAALGTPAYTVARGTFAPVDARLVADRRLRVVTAPAEVVAVKKRRRGQTLSGRDPQLFVDEIAALARRRHGPARLGRLL
jgi:predicted glycosyltransferase